MQKKNFKVTSPDGLHSKNAVMLVDKVVKYDSDISLSYGKITVDLKSIMGIMAMGINCGDIIEILISGCDEIEAINDIKDFIEEKKFAVEI